VVLDGEFLTAEGTTLGADNGTAVAMGLALLESTDIPHPPLTVIMTTNEETGLLGAAKLDPVHLEGRYLLNLDSGADGVFTVGCAGGVRAVIAVPRTKEAVPVDYVQLKVTVRGLLGGHSGGHIKLERGNANKLIGRILTLAMRFDARISSVTGGEKDNAIPRESEAVLCLPKQNLAEFHKSLAALTQNIKHEYATSDPGVEIFTEDATADSCFCRASTLNVTTALNLLPNGVQHMEQDMPGFVETSVSVGVVRTNDHNVEMHSAIRSSVASRKHEVLDRTRYVGVSVSGNLSTSGDYPAWKYKKDSPLLPLFEETYNEMFGSDDNKARFIVTHGGLECGLFLEKAPHLDAIAMGPNTFGIHSPDEKLDIASFGRCWELLVTVLSKMKA